MAMIGTKQVFTSPCDTPDTPARMLVTIVVNCYNRADMVCTALDSVWKQTYRPIELIVIDDGSKDNTFEVVNEWSKTHPDTQDFTTVAKTFPNGKLCLARNRGLALAHGKYIQYVDDDDWLYPDCITEKMVYCRSHPEKDVVVHQVEYIVSGRKSIGTSQITLVNDDSKQTLHLMDTRTDTLFSPTLLFKLSSLKSVGGWTNGLIFADDLDIVFRMAIKGMKFGLVNKPLSAYNMHDADRQCNKVIYQLPDDFWSKLFLNLALFADLNNNDTVEIKESLGKQLLFYGRRQANWGKYNSAVICFKQASKLYPNYISKLPDYMLYLIMHINHFKFVCIAKIKALAKRLLNTKNVKQI